MEKQCTLAVFSFGKGDTAAQIELIHWEWISRRLRVRHGEEWVVLEQHRPSNISDTCWRLYEHLKREGDDAVIYVELGHGTLSIRRGDAEPMPENVDAADGLFTALYDALVDLDRYGEEVFVHMNANGLAGRITLGRDGREYAWTAAAPHGTTWRDATAAERQEMFDCRDAISALKSGDQVVFWNADESEWGRAAYLCPALEITQRGHLARRFPGDDKNWTFHVLPLEIARRYGIPEAADIAA
jgi:hypothetical protein